MRICLRCNWLGDPDTCACMYRMGELEDAARATIAAAEEQIALGGKTLDVKPLRDALNANPRRAARPFPPPTQSETSRDTIYR